MCGGIPQHEARAHQSRIYALHQLTVLVEGQGPRAALRSPLVSLFLLADVLDATIYITHTAFFLTAPLRRGNDI